MRAVRTFSISSFLLFSLSFHVHSAVAAPVPQASESKTKAPSNAEEIPFMGKPSVPIPDASDPASGTGIIQNAAPSGIGIDTTKPLEDMTGIKPDSPVIDQAPPAQVAATRLAEQRFLQGLWLIGGGFALLLALVGGWYWRRSAQIAK